MNAARQTSLVNEFAYRLGYTLEFYNQSAGIVHLRRGDLLIEIPVSLEMSEPQLAKQFGDYVSSCAKPADIQIEHHIPVWLSPLLGRRERLIYSDKRAKFLNVDEDEKRLPNGQQICESPFFGSVTIDSIQRKIIG